LDAGDGGGISSVEKAPKRVLLGTFGWRGRMSMGREVNCFVREGMLIVEKRVSCSNAAVVWKRCETSSPVAYDENRVSFEDVIVNHLFIVQRVPSPSCPCFW